MQAAPEIAAAVLVVGFVGADDAQLPHLALGNKEVRLRGLERGLNNGEILGTRQQSRQENPVHFDTACSDNF